MSDENRLQVMIVSANPLARIGLAALLGTMPMYEVVGQVSPEADLLLLKDRFQADILLWDMGWEMPFSLETMQQLALQGEVPPILALIPDDTEISQLMGLGVAGLLWQSSRPEQLSAALTAIHEGLTVYDPDLLPTPPTTKPASDLYEDLTLREQEVLQLLAQGLANKTIARHLNVSDHTVKFHVNAIMTKLGAQSRTEAVIKAMKLGLVVL